MIRFNNNYLLDYSMGKEKEDKKELGIKIKKSEDFSEWYSETVIKAGMADYAPIRGFMIIKPYAYSIWERIQEYFNSVLRKNGVKNAYFPLLIPESFFKKEAEHAEGFAPELAYVEGGDEGERLALRPTSETIIYDAYSKWVRSWRDLPLKINQWCNVIRWEVKQTKPFIRTREFLWQEGHCVFGSEDDAVENMNEIINEYRKMAEELLAIPVLAGKKSIAEKFAGAKTTMTIEALMPDGKALQMGTSHNLGDNFAKAFNVKFRGKDEKDYYAFQTSWGFSTRLIGAMIMVHGDDKGLVIPPKIAENKAVIVPILFDDSRDKVLKKCREIAKKLDKFGVILDDREGYSPGWKFNEWELKGIPLRIEIGPRDLASKKITIVRRDNGKKEHVVEGKIMQRVGKILEEMQGEMYRKAEKFLHSRIDSAKDIKELHKKLKEGKIIKVYMKNSKEIEAELRDKTAGANSRIIEDVAKEGKCVVSGENVKTMAYVAKGY